MNGRCAVISSDSLDAASCPHTSHSLAPLLTRRQLGKPITILNKQLLLFAPKTPREGCGPSEPIHGMKTLPASAILVPLSFPILQEREKRKLFQIFSQLTSFFPLSCFELLIFSCALQPAHLLLRSTTWNFFHVSLSPPIPIIPIAIG